MLHTQIQEQVREAMKARDEVRVLTLRGLVAAFTNELVATNRKPTELLPDEDVIIVIKRQVKQRKDSIEQFRKGNREDLAAKEEAELAVLVTYLPETMGKDEIRKVAEAKKNEMGVTDKAKAGILMGAVMKELKGKADGGDVKEVIDSLFA